MSYNRPTIQTTYGSCIDWDIEFVDEKGDPEDISTDTFGVIKPSVDSLHQAIFTIVDGPNGKAHMTIPAEAAKEMSVGMGNFFRIRRILIDGCERNSNQIWIHVQ